MEPDLAIAQVNQDDNHHRHVIRGPSAAGCATEEVLLPEAERHSRSAHLAYAIVKGGPSTFSQARGAYESIIDDFAHINTRVRL